MPKLEPADIKAVWIALYAAEYNEELRRIQAEPQRRPHMRSLAHTCHERAKIVADAACVCLEEEA